MPVSLSMPLTPAQGRRLARPVRHFDGAAKNAAVALLKVPLGCPGLEAVPGQDSHGILLIKRSERLRGHSGQWALPGGKQEPGESLWQTAQRELTEETGLDAGAVHWQGELGALETGTGYLAHVFLGELPTPTVLKADGQEAVMLSAYPTSWVTREDTTSHSDVGVIKGQHFCWTEPGGRLPWPTPLWGATAFMLLALRRHLNPGLTDPDFKPRGY